MKEHSLQFKFLMTVMAAILAITIFIGGISIYEVDNYIQDQAQNLVAVTCENEATQINNVFRDMEKSVKIMENYVLSFFESAADIQNKDKQNEAIQFADEMFVNVARNTEGAIAYYFRLDPAISDNTAGVFYSKTDGKDGYTRFTPTDLSLYDKEDTEHVGWYWQPYEAGKPVWMKPYHNQNNNILMISYVVPLYYENAFIGIVGMDFDYTVLTEIIHTIRIYENGFAHLELDNVVIHGSSENAGDANWRDDTEEYLRVSKELANGMTLVLSASYDDIRQIRYEIAYKILFIVLLFTLVFSLLVVFTVKKIVKPLQKLTDASVKLSTGDYDVEIAHSNTREINLLSTAFENMIMNLREHKELQHRLAHRDSLTELRNTTSYKGWITELDRKIKDGDTSFGVAVFDINYLKEVNDTYGHSLGNELIVTVAHLISDTFKRSPVFRIGGDEFVVILQNRDLANQEALFASLNAACETTCVDKDSVRFPISVARGYAEFDAERDALFSDVFERADEEMYKNKRMMKASGK
jgi:diguanylate cyclase (GGDEF)-like protein